MTCGDDRGDIVVGWLMRLTLGLVLFSVLAFDAVSVGLAHIGAQDDGNNAALEGSDAYQSHRNVQRAYAAAVDYADAHHATIRPEEFRVEDDGRVHVTVRKTATTLLLYRIGPLRRWAQVSASADGKSVPS